MKRRGKRSEKMRRKDHRCYLLTTKKTWVLDEVSPAISSLIDAYNNNGQLQQRVIKIEPVTYNVDDVKVEEPQLCLPTDSISNLVEDVTAPEDVLEDRVDQDAVEVAQMPDLSMSTLNNESTEHQEADKTVCDVPGKVDFLSKH